MPSPSAVLPPRTARHPDVPAVLGGLAAVVLSGGGPAELLGRLADLQGRPVALLDTDLRVRTWAAPAALRLAAPPSLPATARDALDPLGPRRPSVLVPARPAHGVARRHLVAVLAVDGGVAGYLDVIEMGRPLGPSDPLVAEQAAALLSLHLLAETRTARAVTRTRDDVVADLVRGSRTPDDLRRVALEVGLDLRRPHLLVRLAVAPGVQPSCAAVAEAAGQALGEAPVALAEPEAVVLLVPLPEGAGPPALRAVHRALRRGLDGLAAATGVRRAVVSGVCADVPDYPAALAETREVDAIVAALGGGDVVPVTELSTLRLVVSGDRADVALRFAEQCIGPLRRSDAESGGDLVATLRGYLASGAQIRATAKALGVHENTVRYRLGRIEHVTGMDMRRFDALLAAQLAFQVESLTRTEGDA